jgi:glycosyltransferase involved in cell wall biosynthesis
MKIAIVCPASLPATQFGGILFLAVDLARELAELKHDITIYTTDLDFANNAHTFNKNLSKEERIDGFKINRTHVWFSINLFYVNPKIYFQIIKDKPDLIHTIGVRSFQSLISAIVSKLYKIPLVISDQGGLTTHPELNKNFIKKILYKLQEPMVKFIVNQATKISVANEYEKQIFSSYNSASKLEIVRNGINLEQYKFLNIEFKKKYKISNSFILFLGRFNEVKGIDTLLLAWARIQEIVKGKNTKLIIMGVDFGFESQMLEIIKNLNLDETVQVIRNPPREDVLSAYSECDFLVLPSRWELSPLTPLEGFAFKKAVISTTAHGIPHTIQNNKHGLLVEPENFEQLSKAIVKFLENIENRDQCGLEGYKLVHEVCNSKVMASNTLKIYEKIIKGKTSEKLYKD